MHRYRFKRFATRAPAYLWAAPATLLGLLLAACLWQRGAQQRWHEGVLEMSSPRLARWLAFPWHGGSGFAAITLGHVVLGRCANTLTRCQAHEHAHVRQYERWGVLLLPAYLFASASARLRGGDAYYDNRFEIEARAAECTRTSD